MAAVRVQSYSSSAPGLLTIGELAERSGVATCALRYYDQLGLVRPTARESGRRRYAASAVAQVGVIRFFREVGFTLAEIDSFLAAGAQRSRQGSIDRKLAEVTEQQHRLEVARELLEHARTCPSGGDPLECSRFWSIFEGHRHGLSLEESHAREHRANPSQTAGCGGPRPEPPLIPHAERDFVWACRQSCSPGVMSPVS
jgi:DNA-binding transcriptional MerR regulator